MPANRNGKATSTALAVLAISTAACGSQIGDSCQTATDCAQDGTRICDISQPGGYCTIVGCDETTCPSEAACIRTFPVEFLTKPCNPYCEDRPCQSPADGGTGGDAGMGAALSLCEPVCGQDSTTTSTSNPCPNGPTNDCTADEVCLEEGLCAPMSTEARFCLKTCGSNSDCRGGYVCRPTGTAGNELLSATPCAQTSICTPAPQ